MLSNVFKSKDQLADKHYQNGSFLRAAELYRKAKRFRAEADCHIQLGDYDTAAKVYEKHGLLQEAAELLGSHDKHKEASSLFERAGLYRQAAESARKVGMLPKAGRLFEKAEMFDEATDCYAEIGETPNAIRALEMRSGQLQAERQDNPSPGIERLIRQTDIRRADLLESLGRHGEAARLLARCGLLTRAAHMFFDAGQHDAAARSYLQAGRFDQALKIIESHGDVVDDEVRAEIYLNCDRRSEAAKIFEQQGKLDAAAWAYQEDGNLEQAARLWEQAENPAQAAELYWQAGQLSEAGRNYLAAGNLTQAVKSFLKAGKSKAAAEVYEKAGRPYKAGLYFAKAGCNAEATRNLLAVEQDDQRAESRREYIHTSLLLVPLLIEEGDLKEAEQRFAFLRRSGVKIPDPDRLYCQARIAEAKGSYRQAQGYYQRIDEARPGFRDVLERLEAVRKRASEEPLGPESQADSEAFPRFFDGNEEIPSDVPSGVFEISGIVGLPASRTENLELPFDMGQPLDPWWDGSTFFDAKDRRDRGRPVLLASFPMAMVGGQAEDFRRAMQRASALRHKTILKLDEVIHASDYVMLVYEHTKARRLDRWMKETQPSPLAALNIIVQLCDALATAHKLGLVHRWISLRTVLVNEERHAKLVGMGLGEILTEQHVGDIALSPEQRDGGIVGPAADLYGLGWLGVILLEASMPANWEKQQSLDPSLVGWPAAVAETIPQIIRDLLIRCLEPNPQRRPQTSELQSALSSLGLVPGQVVVDRYEILGDLGSGGMSRVYRARDLVLSEEVAIKTVLSSVHGRSNEDEQRLIREVQICRRLSHPNIVRVHDIGRFPGGVFVTMEILEGDSLETLLEASERMPAERVRTILLGIAAALSEAHSMSIVHRDLKPGNVIVNGDRVKVLDFGIARRNDGSTAINLTRTGEVIGSPLYMAPEQIQGKPLDGTCDLYALGVIAFTLLSGQEPFTGDNPTAIVLQHVNDPPPSIETFRPDLDAAWGAMLNRLLAKKSTDRYPSAEVLSDVLRALPV